MFIHFLTRHRWVLERDSRTLPAPARCPPAAATLYVFTGAAGKADPTVMDQRCGHCMLRFHNSWLRTLVSTKPGLEPVRACNNEESLRKPKK